MNMASVLPKNTNRSVQTLSAQTAVDNVTFSENLSCSREVKKLLSKLGLNSHFPHKISLQEATKITNTLDCKSFTDIPWILLKNLMMENYMARDAVIDQYFGNLLKTSSSSKMNWNFIKEKQVPQETMKIDDTDVNPIDLIYLLFMCMSPILQGIIVGKMFRCKLAIPFVFPTERGPLIVSTWPIRQLVLEQKLLAGLTYHSPIDSPCNIISFVRLGRLSVSKSRLVNHLLTTQHHNTFLNKDCPLGGRKRTVSNGIIEMFWQLSSTRLDNMNLYLNLRGEGTEFRDQCELLSKLSAVIVVVLDVQNLTNKDSKETLAMFHKNVPKVVLAIDAFVLADEEAFEICKNYLSDIEKIQHYTTKTSICKLAADKVIGSFSDMANDIQSELQEDINSDPIISLAEKIKLSGIKTDELSFKRPFEKAKEVMQLIPASDSYNVKKTVVPLQEEHRERKEADKTKTLNPAAAKTVLTQQESFNHFKALMESSKMMQKFVHFIHKSNFKKSDGFVFMVYLRLFLDERSRKVMATVFQAYEKTLHEHTGQEYSDNEVKCAITNSQDASFGMEHLLRECGHIYEGIREYNSHMKLELEMEMIPSHLSDVVAKMLLHGQPFEIMDGDSSDINIEWVHGVLDEIIKQIGDKKLLTVSVLGIQSSGKSTLLNTMFGLQFGVNAGRCTRGVLIQLVPVDLPNCKFDFILVVDTEGLRAPEVDQHQHDHDNKLATFAMGLGDITIVNIKGENTQEMEDILEITVQAFLRLKLANRKLTLKQSCFFLHQNVSTADARERLLPNRHTLKQKLDKMTTAAAEQEKTFSIKAFEDIISFDYERNVWYFPDLWTGSPPMGHLNPDYSKMAAKVRDCLISKTLSSRNTFFSISETKARIQDLWQGIITDDFVYCFRNSMEVKAYNSLEKRYQEIVWEMDKTIQDFLSNRVKTCLDLSKSESDLNNNHDILQKEMTKQTEEITDELSKRLLSFVETSDLRDVMTQWIKTKNILLQDLKRRLLITADAEMAKLKESKKIDLLQISERTNHEKQINDMARKLAYEMKGRRPSMKTMSRKFSDLWKGFMEKTFSVQYSEDYLSIRQQILTTVRDSFPQLSSFLLQQEEKCSDEDLNILENSMTSTDFQIGEHIDVHMFIDENERSAVDHTKILEKTADIANDIFKCIDSKITEIEKGNGKFVNQWTIDILHIIEETIETFNTNQSTNSQFSLLPPFKALLISHVVPYITEKFKYFDNEYKQSHSLEVQLSEYRETAWELFKNLVAEKTNHTISATFCRKSLEKAIKVRITELVSVHLQDQIVLKFSKEKRVVFKRVLTAIAENADFQDICLYIENPIAFVKTWFSKFVHTEMLKKDTTETHEFAKFVENKIDLLLGEIGKCIEDTKGELEINKSATPDDWIITFGTKMAKHGSLPISPDKFAHMTEYTITDFVDFSIDLSEQLVELRKTVIDYFLSYDKSELIELPNRRKFDTLLGCGECCPFCNEPCKYFSKDHTNEGIDHQCLQHRITGLWGKTVERSKKLSARFCNLNIYIGDTFFQHYEKTKNTEWIDCKHYKKLYPDWNIRPTYDTPKYWAWILCTFQEDFEKKYGKPFTNIIESWKSITKSQAIQSLDDC